MIFYHHINPIALRLGSLSIYWYGLLYAIGLLITNCLACYRAKQSNSGWTCQQVFDLEFSAMIGAVLGGRLGYVLFYDLHYYIENPGAIVAIWEGGLSFHGGLIGVLLALKWCSWQLQKPFLEVSDFVATLVPLSIALGRLGNFINGELWGRVTTFPYAVIFSKAGSVPRHPSQLYECLLEGCLLFVILWEFSKKKRPVGAISGLFASLYVLIRFGIEFLREPDAHLGFIAWGWLTMGQLLSLPLLIAGLLLLYFAYWSKIRISKAL
jgi:phosphatidylglycerol---prolipoprotein diacylglyceryl transferase